MPALQTQPACIHSTVVNNPRHAFQQQDQAAGGCGGLGRGLPTGANGGLEKQNIKHSKISEQLSRKQPRSAIYSHSCGSSAITSSRQNKVYHDRSRHNCTVTHKQRLYVPVACSHQQLTDDRRYHATTRTLHSQPSLYNHTHTQT